MSSKNRKFVYDARGAGGTQPVAQTAESSGTSASDGSEWVLESKLEPGMLRFMAHVIENGLQIGLRTPEDFIRHFPPSVIMSGLKDRPDLRANILGPCTGVRSKIAHKKSAESAGTVLQIALDEGETHPETIVSLFHPDDRVRYLDAPRLWSYVIENGFWKAGNDGRQTPSLAKTHVAFMLDRAIEDRLLTERDIIEGISVKRLVKCLPLEELQNIIESTLDNAHESKAFTEKDFLEAVPTERLAEYVPLTALWESVIHPKVAVALKLTGVQQAAAAQPSQTSAPATSTEATDEQAAGESTSEAETTQNVDQGAVHAETY
jgi:hypothetical protein